jgi:hypothetical protein
MAYTNLDELLNRANKFDQIGDAILDAQAEDVQGLELSIESDDRLFKIFKIAKILKNSKIKSFNFDEIKNIDPNFICDGTYLIVKFENSPIELNLQFSDDGNSSSLGVSGDYSINDLFNFYNKTLNYIEIFEQKFIKTINNIFKQQDTVYSKFYKN